MKRRLAFLSAVAGIGIVACSTPPKNPLAEKEAFFTSHVKPVLERNCLRCHNGVVVPHRINLTDRTLAFAAKRKGKAYIVPGKPDESLLITAVSRGGTHPQMMPRLTMSLTDDQIGVLREWIEDGAVWPEGPSGKLVAVKNPENP
jgi:hypothetical protein